MWGAFDKYTKEMKLWVSGGWLVGKRSCVKDGWTKDYRSFKAKDKLFAKYFLNQHLITSLGGAMSQRYFSKKKHAEKFMAEIYAGHHPWAVEALRTHHLDCDRLEDFILGFNDSDDY